MAARREILVSLAVAGALLGGAAAQAEDILDRHDRLIVARCEKAWPRDEPMRAHCIDTDFDASYALFRARIATGGTTEQKDAYRDCLVQWSDDSFGGEVAYDWRMVKNCYDYGKPALRIARRNDRRSRAEAIDIARRNYERDLKAAIDIIRRRVGE